MLKVSGEACVWIFVERGDVVASYAAMSAFSFPGILIWAGFHMKHIGKFVSDINLWMCWTSSFMA